MASHVAVHLRLGAGRVGTASGASSPGWFTTVGDRVVFSAENDAVGRELWVTDGTAAGTRLLADLDPGAG